MKGRVKTIAILLVLTLLFSIFAPTMKVFAENDIVINFVFDSSYTNIEADNPLIKFKDNNGGNYVIEIKNGSGNTVGRAEVNEGSSPCIVIPSTETGLKIYYPDDVVQIKCGETVLQDGSDIGNLTGTFNVTPASQPPVSQHQATIDINADSYGGADGGLVARYENSGHNIIGEILITGTDLNDNQGNGPVTTSNAQTITFSKNEGPSNKITIDGTEQTMPYSLQITADDIQNNKVFNIEYNTQEQQSSRKTSSVTVNAGSGTYGNNKAYDSDIDFFINGARWDHSNSISYNVAEEATTVTFKFETLWINRYYEDIEINGQQYTVSDYLDFDDRTQWLTANHGTQTVSFEIPDVAKADSYNIVAKHGENTRKAYFATFLWTADPAQAGSHDYIGNSKLEFVKATYEVGGTKYTVTEKDLEGRLVREGDFESATSQDGFLNYGVVADVGFDDGSLTLPGGAEVTMRVVPDYGYQVTSVNGGNSFKTTDSGISEFTVTVEEGTAGYFQATVEKVDNTVKPVSEKVKAGNIKLGENAATDIKSGTVRLSVEDVELTSDKITNFEEKANEAGDYKITNYLDINLDKIVYRGTADDVWEQQIHRLTDKALITLQLEDGVDASNIVIVHNIDNGDEFEIIPIESYDAETNTISFYTNSFSNYAIASKTESTKQETANNSSNPTTGDNIIALVTIFTISTVLTLATIKINKNRKIRKK